MLSRAIDRLYEEFADEKKPRQIEGCPCCINKKEIQSMLSSSLREISPDDLTAYAASAFLTVGDKADYLYFLPRILEITVIDESWYPDPEITGRAIHAANPAAWPAHRLDALLSFNAAVIQSEIDSGQFSRLDSWMCTIARMGFDVQPHLQVISKCPAAVLAYFEDNSRCLPQNRLCNGFWELPNEGHDAIVKWFYSDEIRMVPFEAYGYEFEPER